MYRAQSRGIPSHILARHPRLTCVNLIHPNEPPPKTIFQGAPNAFDAGNCISASTETGGCGLSESATSSTTTEKSSGGSLEMNGCTSCISVGLMMVWVRESRRERFSCMLKCGSLGPLCRSKYFSFRTPTIVRYNEGLVRQRESASARTTTDRVDAGKGRLSVGGLVMVV